MRLLVTGSSGFIGSHIRNAALKAGYDVVRCDPRSDGRYWNVADLHPMDKFDVAVHCAAAVVSTGAKATAGIGVAENLEIDAAFFRWAAAARPGRVVYFSSSCAYPAQLCHVRDWRLSERAISLRAPQWPDGLYGWCKLTGEQLAAQLAEDGIPVTVVRPFSVYGPGMQPGFAVSGFVDQARAKADPLIIWGDDTQTRDFIHVADVAAATLAAIESNIQGPVNLGTGVPTSLAGLAGLVAAGYQPAIKTDRSLPRGLPYLVADNTRLASFCPPQVTLGQGIEGMLSA